MKAEYAKRAAGEFVVIVLGVMVALAVDDARAVRVDRDREAYYLETLTHDLASDAAELRRLLAQQDSIRVAAYRLSKHLGDPLTGPLSQHLAEINVELDRASALILEPLDFESARATYDEMVASGSLRVLRSETLRRSLAQYYLAAERLDNEEAGRARIAADEYQLAVRRHGFLAFEPGSNPELLDRLRGDDRALATVRGAGSRGGLLEGRQQLLLGQAEALLTVLGERSAGSAL